MRRRSVTSDELTGLVAAACGAMAADPDGLIHFSSGTPDHPTRPWPSRWEWYAVVEVSRHPVAPGWPRALTQSYGRAFTRWGARRRAERELDDLLGPPGRSQRHPFMAAFLTVAATVLVVRAFRTGPTAGLIASAALVWLVGGLLYRNLIRPRTVAANRHPRRIP